MNEFEENKYFEIKNELLESVVDKKVDSYFVGNHYNIDGSKFKIDNIRITDLYKLAAMENKSNPDKCTRWQKIIIPNDFLYEKVREIVLSGMYYMIDNMVVLEVIKGRTSDFKISISIDEMSIFLKNIMN